MFSKEMSCLVPTCNCIQKSAEERGLVIYGLPYVDVKVGYGGKFDRIKETFSTIELYVDLRYCPQCGKAFTKLK